ncbi:unnamed protein product [Dicrocoelium dendriticum]|nr:unnamed protein product [Dicrocoelium dendriticum]
MTVMDAEDSADEQQFKAIEPAAKAKDETVGLLRAKALQRRQRLLNLRKCKDQQRNDLDDNGDDLPKPFFRNYKPLSENLKSGELPPAESIDLTPYVASQLEAANTPDVLEEVNLVSLAPRKPDWDLKRGVEKKLQKLERRTQRAIAEIIRERLHTTDSDLATAVSQHPVPMEQ